ncbi:hypothetical protein ANN_07742 [Periplaneta americana]|uniref:Uncharacterized protein n=1 Tax=Periplaneta americana TaxID=6978 RepID=A0ABQ8SZF6_PERAM|nr:hypothetical protein ANN_07742 [Periplaneta americana]
MAQAQCHAFGCGIEDDHYLSRKAISPPGQNEYEKLTAAQNYDKLLDKHNTMSSLSNAVIDEDKDAQLSVKSNWYKKFVYLNHAKEDIITIQPRRSSVGFEQTTPLVPMPAPSVRRQPAIGECYGMMTKWGNDFLTED